MRGLSHQELLTALRGILQGPNSSVALLLIDIADLPTLQARLGFEVSAALLKRLSERFAQALGERGSVLRFGDARFCVLVRAIRNRGHAVLAAEKLARAAEEAMTDAAVTIAPEINIGIALYPLQAADAESLLRKAQLAAAAVHKRAARLQVFDESCTEQVLTPWELGDAFAAALRSGELQVHYQPKVRIADGRAVGVEALMRWLRDGRPVAAPGTGEQSTPSELGEKKSNWLSFEWTKKEEYGTFTGEPPRVSLTDPPPGYQTPSPDQPYGIAPEHKTVKPSTLEQRVEPVH